MQTKFKTTLIKKHSRLPARVTQVDTPHGSFMTPTFMPVGTRAAVNCMTAQELLDTKSQIILGGNTYHMLVSPGTAFIQDAGGMHRMMAWNRPMLTDSGGYQVFSLSQNSQICKINEVGAKFKHPETGKFIAMTPQSSIETQKIIGADIIMAFDQCTPDAGGREVAVLAMERTHRWLLQSIETHQKNTQSAYGHEQALFGIVQGGLFRDLREQSLEFLLQQSLDGIAIGGESIGYSMEKTVEILHWLTPHIPPEKTRYSMGVGLSPQDLIDVVACGIDIFDCVAPTRNARHGSLYCGQFVETDNHWITFDSDEDRGRLLIKKQQYRSDHGPISPECDCYTCEHHSRSYLHFLFKTKAPLYAPLACIHNVRMMQIACENMQKVILQC
jgi:queuine tRNA-ribosyltransferase